MTISQLSSTGAVHPLTKSHCVESGTQLAKCSLGGPFAVARFRWLSLAGLGGTCGKTPLCSDDGSWVPTTSHGFSAICVGYLGFPVGSLWFSWVLLGSLGFRRLVMGSDNGSWVFRVLLNSLGLSWVLLSSIMLSWVLFGSLGFSWVALSSLLLSWVPLDGIFYMHNSNILIFQRSLKVTSLFQPF